ncbi:MAG: hypothetical protein WC668_00740 [Patescibacteria group bacterium]|jgi:hypothetical protein
MSQEESDNLMSAGNNREAESRHERDLSDEIKIAVIRAEKALKERNLPVTIIYNSLLNGLAMLCGGHVELIRQLLSLKNEAEDGQIETFVYALEDIFSWYLSAKFSSQEIFSWFGGGGLKDDEITNALVMSLLWNGTDYEGLSDEAITDYILASHWDQPRQMAAMVRGGIITPHTLRLLNNFYGGMDVVMELIGKGGCFDKDALRVVQTIHVPSNKDPKKTVPQWTKRKIWYFWDRLGITDEQKISLFHQALGVESLVAFLRSLPMNEKQIIVLLQSLSEPLGTIADMLSSKVVPKDFLAGDTDQPRKISVDATRIPPEFISFVKEQGKSDQELVGVLMDHEFTLYMIATSLIAAGWEPFRTLIALLQSGCNFILVSRMIEAAAESFKAGHNSIWKPEVIAAWRKLVKDKMEESADHEIFGQP